MQFLDQAKIYVCSGSGGRGCVSFRREKNLEFGGPNGGNGGCGGNVIAKATKGLITLTNFRYCQHFRAENGQHGMGKSKTGRAGKNLMVSMPIGTQIWDESKKLLLADFVEANQSFLLAEGGKGGFGNEHYKNSIRRAPKIASPGFSGQEMWIWLRLKLLADVGLVGLPNAGKSTLLSCLTRAHPKIGSYPFTTLYPQLGILSYSDRELIIADLPGLIEKAHEGKGMGHRFLGHIERCQVILHLIDSTCADPLKNYHLIREELNAYENTLLEKTEVIVLNKIDLLCERKVELLKKKFSLEKHSNLFFISGVTGEGISQLKTHLLQSITP